MDAVVRAVPHGEGARGFGLDDLQDVPVVAEAAAAVFGVDGALHPDLALGF